MPIYDLIIRNGILVTASEVRKADIAISGESVAEVETSIDGTAKEVLDASNLYIFPGVIDAHVHFNEPGRASWEGFGTGTIALAAGGTTTFFDMPLNSHPPTVDAAAFDQKLAAASAASLVDFGLWGGIIPGSVEHMDELVERGVIGFKAFMCNSGIDDFPACDDGTLYDAMQQAARLGAIVAVHAENEGITSTLARKAVAAGKLKARDYISSRPVVAELEAISRAIFLAEETGCALHIVHVSSGRGVAMVAEAHMRGVDVSCETCPHYLSFTEDDLDRLGGMGKCSPPLRPRSEQDALWRYLLDGTLTMVASDHSPSPPGMKQEKDFFRVWGGISGCQTMLQVLLTEGCAKRKLSLTVVAEVLSEYVARRFKLWPTKGHLTPGADADLSMVDLASSSMLQTDDLLYRYQQSPYVGKILDGRTVRTMVRGKPVFVDGRVVSGPIGQLVKPTRGNLSSQG